MSARIAAWPADSPLPIAELRCSLGQSGELESETAAILEMEGVRSEEFEGAVLACLPKTPWRIGAEDEKGRRDFRCGEGWEGWERAAVSIHSKFLLTRFTYRPETAPLSAPSPPTHTGPTASAASTWMTYLHFPHNPYPLAYLPHTYPGPIASSASTRPPPRI